MTPRFAVVVANELLREQLNRLAETPATRPVAKPRQRRQREDGAVVAVAGSDGMDFFQLLPADTPHHPVILDELLQLLTRRAVRVAALPE